MISWIHPRNRQLEEIAIKQRVLTALIALPLLLGLIAFANPFVFSLFLAAVIFLALLEFNRMGLASEHRPEQWLAACGGASTVPFLYYQQGALLLPVLSGVFLVLAMMFLFRLPNIVNVHHRIGWLCLGFFYLPLLLSHIWFLRQLESGRAWIFLVLLAVMLCDTCAYFFGSNFGKRKLYPAVSPNKSIEGGLGGLAGAVLAVLIAGVTFLPEIGVVDGVVVGLLLGVVGQLGDLFESLLKRACEVKDSGSMIPGHGGLLDRLDSLLFAFALAYYIARFGYGG